MDRTGLNRSYRIVTRQKEPTLIQSNATSHSAQSSEVQPRQIFATHVLRMLGLRVIVGSATIGSAVIVARWLGPVGLGILTTIQVTILAAVQLGTLGLPAAGTYFVARDRHSLAPLVVNALIFSLLAGSILAFTLMTLATSETRLFGDIPDSVMMVAAISIPFQLVILFGGSVFLGVGRILTFNVTDVAAQTSLLVSAVIALVMLGAGLYGLVSFNTIVYGLLSVIVIVMVYRLIDDIEKNRLRLDLNLFGRLIRYGVKFHVATVAGILVFRVDLLFVKYFRGADEAGVYAIASQAGMVMMMLPNIIGTLLFPRVAAARDLSGELTARVTRHTAFIMFLVCLLAAPASFALPVIFGEPFNDATIQFLLLLPGIFLIGVESVLVQHFSGTGLPLAIPLLWLLTLAAHIALNMTLVPEYGARGAAVSSAISYGLIFVFIAIYFRRQTGSRLVNALLTRPGEIRALLTDLVRRLKAEGRSR